jgi:hypothetical protein
MLTKQPNAKIKGSYERKADLVYGMYGVEGGPQTNNFSAIKPS